MELVNATAMRAGYAAGLTKEGRELLVVVVKGAFTFPGDGGEPIPTDEKVPFVDADTYTGEPGLSAPEYESDWAPVKHRCDVLLLGSAYAPGSVPAARVRVSLRVGPVSKSFDVVGNRYWSSDLFGAVATDAEPFTAMPFSYDAAFGGLDNLDADFNNHLAFEANPAGRGFFPVSGGRRIAGKPMPNTEESGNPVTSPNRRYVPMSFGAIGRSWRPRRDYAGTYDRNWTDNVFPFLPGDFNELYYQCAPPDQQMDYIRGGEAVELLNLTPEGYTAFRLPAIEVPVAFYAKSGDRKEIFASADTLVIEPDHRRFTIVWRASLPLRRNLFEIERVVVGRMPPGWYRARAAGKPWYPSLRHFIDARDQRDRVSRAETE